MNHLFNNITWLGYAELLSFALLIYYLYVGLRWYRSDIAKFLRWDRPSGSAQMQVLSSTDMDDTQEADAPGGQTDHQQDGQQQTEMLTMALLASIAESSNRPYEPEANAQKLRTIIGRYPQLRNSPQRAAINCLVVSECKKSGIAQLSEEMVDQWWQ